MRWRQMPAVTSAAQEPEAGVTETRVVKWGKEMAGGDFLAAVLRAGGLSPGAVVTVEYLHDEDCPRLAGRACRCDPEVVATILLAGAT